MMKVFFILICILLSVLTHAQTLSVEQNDGKVLKLKIYPERFCFHSSQLQALFFKLEDNKKVLIKSQEIPCTSQFLNYENLNSGAYQLRIKAQEIDSFDENKLSDRTVWVQDFFVLGLSDRSIDKSFVAELAMKFAPLSLLPQEERYSPTSLPYIMNQIEKDERLDRAHLVLKLTTSQERITFPFEQLEEVLSLNGDRNAILATKTLFSHPKSVSSLIRKRTGRGHETIYYSLIPNTLKNEYYLNYHYFYTFDPKTGTEKKPNMSEHVFDRESFSIVLDHNFLPQAVVLGAHLPNQRINFEDNNGKVSETWTEGRVRIKWADLLKVEDHPIISVALGSHALYPSIGQYTITGKRGYLKKFVILRESAGGNTVLLPKSMKQKLVSDENKLSFITYDLVDLELDNITQSSWNHVLNFSGKMVDLLALSYARFPPFTEREMSSQDWIHNAYEPQDFLKFMNEQTLEMRQDLQNSLGEDQGGGAFHL